LPDILNIFCNEGFKVVVVAGKPGVASEALSNMRNELGDCAGIKAYHGYLDDKSTANVIKKINSYEPDIIIVGMGTPVQERWVLANRDRINAQLVWTVGAVFDYFAGEQDRGPIVLRKAGHEWLARLWTDPGRLWKRYLVGNPKYLARVLKDRLQRNKFLK
jgi:N-acetylglucosaminyldiphosphoundecaprenol N-acetyl-beta-D-mannosaminyltransferase